VILVHLPVVHLGRGRLLGAAWRVPHGRRGPCPRRRSVCRCTQPERAAGVRTGRRRTTTRGRAGPDASSGLSAVPGHSAAARLSASRRRSRSRMETPEHRQTAV